MAATNRHPKRDTPKLGDLPDFGAISLGQHPARTMRILGLVRAGHSYRHIIEVGYYQQSWSRLDVDKVLRENRVTLPDAADPSPHSRRVTSARTVNLSPRQAAICHYLCQAMNEDEIGEAMGLSVGTVRIHIRRALRATGCRDRLGLVVAILSGSLVPVEDADV